MISSHSTESIRQIYKVYTTSKITSPLENQPQPNNDSNRSRANDFWSAALIPVIFASSTLGPPFQGLLQIFQTHGMNTLGNGLVPNDLSFSCWAHVVPSIRIKTIATRNALMIFPFFFEWLITFYFEICSPFPEFVTLTLLTTQTIFIFNSIIRL